MAPTTSGATSTPSQKLPSPLHQHQGVHAGHERSAMGPIDHPQQTEDHGQSKGDQDQNAGNAQSVEDLRQAVLPRLGEGAAGLRRYVLDRLLKLE